MVRQTFYTPLLFLFLTLFLLVPHLLTASKVSVEAFWVEKHPGSTNHKIVIPFRLVGRLTLVEALIDGKEGSFILDTGAPSLILNRKHFPTVNHSRKGRKQGINGRVDQVYEKVIKRMYWNGINVKNLLVDVVDLEHIEKVRNVKLLGLIGYQLFKNYEVVFNYSAQQIILYELDRKGRRKAPICGETLPTDSMKITMISHIPCIKKQIGDAQLLLGIDSGAEINLLKKNLRTKLKDLFSPMGETTLHGVNNSNHSSVSGRLRQFWLDCLKYENMITLFTDIQILEFGNSSRIDGILGYEFLSQHKVSINFRKRQLYYWRDAEADCIN